MSVPHGSCPISDEVQAHRARVFDALSRHSDPALREIGRLLAGGTVSPHQLLDDPRHAETLRRGARKLQELAPEQLHRRVFGTPAERAGAPPGAEGGPASRPDDADPDNGAGGVPAIRR